MQPTSTATDRTLPKVVTKIVVSVALGGLAYLATLPINDSARAQMLWGIGASLFVGGLAFVVQFLMDVDRTMTAFGRRIEDGLATVTDGAALNHLLKASPLGTETKDLILQATQAPTYSS